MIPNAADFQADTDDAGHIWITCPHCDHETDLGYTPEIRDLIAAASAHAVSHARATQDA